MVEELKNVHVSNRRSSNRIDARIEVQFRSGNEFVACYSQNISKGGIYLDTPILPDPNALIEIVLKLPTKTTQEKVEAIKLKARVVRLMSVSTNGQLVHKVALQFVEIPVELQLQLDTLYAEVESNPSKFK